MDRLLQLQGLAITAAGSETAPLRRAIQNRCTYRQRHPALRIAAKLGKGYVPAFYAPTQIPLHYSLWERICSLWQQLLDELTAQAWFQPTKFKLYVHWLLPSAKDCRSKILNPKHIKQLCKDLSLEQLSFSSIDQGVIAHWQQCLQSLPPHPDNLLLFIAIDSLVDPDTLAEVQRRKKLMSTQNTEGYAPGEAAVMLLVRQTTQQTTCPTITCSHHESSLVSLMKSVPDSQQQHFIHPYQHKSLLVEEWHQVYQRFWLQPTKKGSMKIPKVTTIEPVLGDIGTAAIPLSIALADDYVRQDGHSKVTVCELTPYCPRGLISLLSAI